MSILSTSILTTCGTNPQLLDGYLKNSNRNSTNYYNPTTSTKVDDDSGIDRLESIERLTPSHVKEWRESAIDRDLIALNLISTDSEDRIASWYFGNLGEKARRNDGRIRDGYLNVYRDPLKGGWAIAGYDPLALDAATQWRCFKPDVPRKDSSGKSIKYDLPKGGDFNPILPRVSWRVAYLCVATCEREKVRRANNDPVHTPLADLLVPENLRESGEECHDFWTFVLNYKIPITLAEGGKKCLSLLSQGRVAIGLLSVTLWREKGGDLLHPWLIPFVDGRQFFICFDRDSKRKTQRAVNVQAFKLAIALKKEGARAVKRLSWKGAQKGIDDRIYHLKARENKNDSQIRDELAWNYKYAESAAKFPDLWNGTVAKVNLPRGEFTLENLRESLSESEREKFDNCRVLVLKADKGIGKTELVSQLVDRAIEMGEQTLLVSFLQSLAREGAARTGLPYRKPNLADVSRTRSKKEFKELTEDNKTMMRAIGYALVADSFQRNNSVPFCSELWQDAHLVLDEADRVLLHIASGETEIKKVRASVVAATIEKVRDCYENEKTIVLSGADVTPAELDLIQDLICQETGLPREEVGLATFIALNEAKNPRGQALIYEEKAQWRLELGSSMQRGESLLIQTTTQKPTSPDGSIALERLALKHYRREEIVRIDSDSLQDKANPFCGLSGKALAAKMKEMGIKILITSPSIATGFDLSGLDGYFSGVWLVSAGNLPVELVSQMLCRLRDFNCPRHIYCPKMGTGFSKGSRSTNPIELQEQFQQIAKGAYSSVGCANVEEMLSKGTSPFDSYRARKNAEINRQMWQYRESLVDLLETEGWRISICDPKGELEAAIEPLTLKSLIDSSLTPEEAEEYGRLNEAIDDLDRGQKEAMNVRKAVRAEAIAHDDRLVVEAPTVGEAEASALEKKHISGEGLTESERSSLRKYTLSRKWGGIEVKDPLLQMERAKLYGPLMLRYFLTKGRDLVASHGRKILEDDRARNGGKHSTFDFVRSQKITDVALWEHPKLELWRFLEAGREWSNETRELIELADFVRENVAQVNRAFTAGIGAKDSPITIVQKLLKRIGLQLPFLRHIRTKEKKRLRIYGSATSLARKFISLPEEKEIFSLWDGGIRDSLKNFTPSDIFHLLPEAPPPKFWNEWDREGGTAVLAGTAPRDLESGTAPVINNIYIDCCATPPQNTGTANRENNPPQSETGGEAEQNIRTISAPDPSGDDPEPQPKVGDIVRYRDVREKFTYRLLSIAKGITKIQCRETQSYFFPSLGALEVVR